MDFASMKFGERMKVIRKNQHLTQEQLAQKAGISVNSVRLYESGKRTPKIETAEILARVLQCEMFELLDERTSQEILQRKHIEDLTELIRSGKTEWQKNAEHEAMMWNSLCNAYQSMNMKGKARAVGVVADLSKVPEYKLNSEEE